MSKDLFYQKRYMNLEYTLFITWVAIEPPENVSSRRQPKYVTFAYCLIFLPFYWMFKSYIKLKLLLSKISISLMSLCWNIRQEFLPAKVIYI